MKNGFTLVELLAVIVILSVIALITTIATGSIVNNSRNSLSEIQVSKIEEAAQVYYLNVGVGYETDEFSECVSVERLLEKGYIDATEILDPKTNKSITGSVLISYSSNKYSYKYQEDSCKYCEPVDDSTKTTGNVPSGNYEQGDEYICEVKSGVKYHFFVLSVEENNVNLILNRNIYYNAVSDTSMLTDNNYKGYVSFISREDYNDDEKFDNPDENKADKGPITAMKYLYNATKNWYNIPNIYINYEDEGGGYGGIKTENDTTRIKTKSGEVTAEYTNLKARLPYKSEILDCTDVVSNSCLSFYNYLGKFEPSSNSSYISRVAETDETKVSEIEKLSGYLTFSSANPSKVDEEYKNKSPIYYAWRVGKAAYTEGYDDDSFGVRPVITVPKSDF